MSNPKPKHTPGPWVADGNGFAPTYDISTTDKSLATITSSRADADLIAAAPELLAWTMELLAQLKRDHPIGMDGIKEHVENLIKRATGGAE